MQLFIDAGNTRIKWAIIDPTTSPKLGEWTAFGSLTHSELDEANPPWKTFSIQGVLISNVSGNTIRDKLTRALQHTAPIKWLTSQAELAGIQNHYQQPTQLGSDRFAAAIGAHALFPKKSIIMATCGTALTIDAVTADGVFLGGMIAPGLQLMAQSLAKHTAQLPLVDESVIQMAHFANYTEAAMISGCLAAQAGAIEHAVAEFIKEHNTESEIQCILSGGAAKYIIPSIKIPHIVIDNVVLTGLQVIFSC